MRILDSSVNMTGKANFTEVDTKEENLNFWVGKNRNNPPGDTKAPGVFSSLPKDRLVISEEGREKLSQQLSSSASRETGEAPSDFFSISDEDKRKILLIEEFIRALTGKQVKIRLWDSSKIKRLDLGQSAQPASAPPQQGWGLIYNYRESHYEKETMNFSSEGMVTTADGRKIQFSVELNMSREFFTEKSLGIRAGDAVKVDPLAINFDGAPPSLTAAKYSFDLDCDGTPDQISFLAPGSGFLALDANNDGIINDGSELFGPKSGDGFADLGAYDSDGNGWIDENDPIYDKLRIWTKDENGKDKLLALGQKGIGAIYLGNVDTSFGIKNSENALLGQIRKTGIFLKEEGGAGTLQHIDLII